MDHKTFLIAAVVILATGCGKPQAPAQPEMKSIGSVQEAVLPEQPAPANVQPVTQDIDGARTDTSSAQQDVRKVLTAAEGNPAAAAALPPLNHADGKLSDALLKLQSADNHARELETAIQKSEEARKAREAALNTERKELRKTGTTNEKVCEKTIGELTTENAGQKKEIARLNDENIQKTQSLLRYFGIACLLAAVACGALAYFGSFGGIKFAAFFGPAGCALIALAQMVPTIVFGFEWLIWIAGGCAVAWLGWHLFKHDPKAKSAPVPTAGRVAPGAPGDGTGSVPLPVAPDAVQASARGGA